MADGIGKSVGQQFESIGRQVVGELASIPKSIVGMDSGGTHESKGASGGGKQSAGWQKSTKTSREQEDPLASIRQQSEVDKQKKIAEVRRRLMQLMNGQSGEKPKTPFEEKQLEELEKQKQELAQMKAEAKQLKMPAAKRPRGDLYGIKAKKFGGEQSKNVVSQ